MDKKDILYVVAALGIILVIAVVIKPAVTGQPVNLGIGALQIPGHPSSEVSLIPVTYTTNKAIPATSRLTTTTVQPSATSNSTVQTLGLISVSQYTAAPTPNSTSVFFDMNWTTIATISNKGSSGTSQTFYIPAAMWEIVYTISPMTPQVVASTQITATLGQGISYSGVQGAYSSFVPIFSIQVVDAGDPNRTVGTITPPGGIHPELWAGISPTTPAVGPGVTTRPKYAVIAATPTTPSTWVKPPWTETFMEGYHSYYFVITSQFINSYTIDVKVPTRYINST
jgi:hypothetical protein